MSKMKEYNCYDDVVDLKKNILKVIEKSNVPDDTDLIIGILETLKWEILWITRSKFDDKDKGFLESHICEGDD